MYPEIRDEDLSIAALTDLMQEAKEDGDFAKADYYRELVMRKEDTTYTSKPDRT